MMLKAAGGFLLIMGVLWALQGAGLVDWPRGSFMIAQGEWVGYGALTALCGAAMLWWAWRRARG
jgi:hypothetical protein